MAGSQVLAKTGQLAERADILPSKVRFYLQQGLLHPMGYTPGGHFLFDESKAIGRLCLIARLKAEQRREP